MRSIIQLCLIVLLANLLQTGNAQNNKNSKKEDKIYYGGGVGLSFGSYTQIAVHPLIGYKITPKLSAGITASYEYFKDTQYTPTYSTYNYGGSLFSRYKITQELYAHAEYANINSEIYSSSGMLTREWIPFLFVGGGYCQQISEHVSLNFQIVFDVLQDSRSPYKSGEPQYGMGIGVGF